MDTRMLQLLTAAEDRPGGSGSGQRGRDVWEGRGHPQGAGKVSQRNVATLKALLKAGAFCNTRVLGCVFQSSSFSKAEPMPHQ